MTIRAVLFDLDGVLFDSVNLHKQAFNRALKQVRGFEIDDDTDLNGKPTKTKLAILHSQGKIDLCDFEAIQTFKQFYTMNLLFRTCQKDESKIELFKYLRENEYKIAIVTNAVNETTRFILDRLEICPDFVVTNQQVRNPKPSCEPYIKAMANLIIPAKRRTRARGLCSEECIIVEDSPVGLEAARNTGAYVWQVKNATEVNVAGFIKFNETI